MNNIENTPILFQPRQKLLFIGDSITDAGRSRVSPYGDGYVREVQRWLHAAHPHLNLTIINKGVSGDTTRDLLARWRRDAIRPQPDWLFIKIGINDVWSVFEGFYRQRVDLKEFERNYRELISLAQAETKAQIILIEPFLVERNQMDNFRKVVAHYQERVARIAQDNDLQLVNLQEAFDRGLSSQPIEFWAEDRVHPTAVGHTLIAIQVLKACGSL